MKIGKDIYETIKERRSIRRFADIPVEYDKIMFIIDAGRWAPNAGNLNSVRFILVDNPELIKNIAKYAYEQDWIQEAKYIIVICTNDEKLKIFYPNEWKKFSIQDATAAAENMLLMAHALGLGSCFVGAFKEDKIRDILGIPNKATPHIILPIGYPDEEPLAPKREDFWYVVYINKYGNKIRDIAKILWQHGVVVKEQLKKVFEAIGYSIEKGVEKIRKK